MNRLLWFCCSCLAVSLSASESFDLPTCLNYATQHALPVQRADLDLQVAGLEVGSARATFHPRLHSSVSNNLTEDTYQGSGSISQDLPGAWNVSLSGEAQGGSSDSDRGLSVQARISKLLLGGSSIEASLQGIRDAEIDLIIARNSNNKTRRQLIKDVTAAYYRVIREKRTLVITQLKVENAARNLEVANERDRVIDITNAEIQVSETADELLRGEKAIQAAIDSLKLAIGMPITDELLVIDDFLYAAPQVDGNADLAWSLANHEDLLNVALRQRKGERAERVARENRLPDLSVFASATDHNSASGWNLDDDEAYSIGLDLRWTLGRQEDHNAWLKRGIELRRLDIERFDLEQKKRDEIAGLLRRLEEASARIALAEQRLHSREKLVALYQDRYENGEIDILEYIRAQNDLENAKVNLVTGQIDHLQILAEYRFAVGR